jgi:hypothetical protein
MIRKITIASFLIVVVLTTQQLKTEPDTELIPKIPVYLGIGYNLLKGNPLDDRVD